MWMTGEVGGFLRLQKKVTASTPKDPPRVVHLTDVSNLGGALTGVYPAMTLIVQGNCCLTDCRKLHGPLMAAQATFRSRMATADQLES